MIRHFITFFGGGTGGRGGVRGSSGGGNHSGLGV